MKKIKETKKEPDYKAPVVAKKSRSQVLLAENFTPHPLLENFVDQKFRSLVTVKLMSPANGDTVKNPVVLKVDPSGQTIDIVILNNRNVAVWQSQSGKSEIKISQLLIPGLYYWKIIVRDELVGVRKFFIVN